MVFHMGYEYEQNPTRTKLRASGRRTIKNRKVRATIPDVGAIEDYSFTRTLIAVMFKLESPDLPRYKMIKH